MDSLKIMPVKNQRYSLSKKRLHEDWINQGPVYPTNLRKLLGQRHGGMHVYASN